MSSRRRPRRPLWLWLVAIAAVAAAGWWWLGSGDDAPSPTVVTEPGDRTAEVEPARDTEITFAPSTTSTPEATRPSPPAARPTPPTTSATTSSTTTPTPIPPKSIAETPTPSRPQPVRNTTAVAALEQAAASAANDPVTARASLTRAWLAGLDGVQRDNASRLSRRLAESTLLTTPGRAETPYARPHRVMPNEVLGKIIRNESVEVNAAFLARINGLRSPDNVRQGRDLWLPNGRFHAVVDLSERDLAVFQETEGRRDLLVVMPVGIGVDGLTPQGLFRVKPGSKSSNPSWTDPATGRHWKSDDTGNPIGEHWIGLEALDETDRENPAYRSLGLHGTTQPETVGTACTNGSLRLLGDDVELLFQILGSGTSTVEIRE